MVRRVVASAVVLSAIALASMPLSAARPPCAPQDGGPFIQDEPRAMVEEYIQQYGHKKGQGGTRAAKNGTSKNGRAQSTTHALGNGVSKLLAKPKKKSASKKKAKAGAR